MATSEKAAATDDDVLTLVSTPVNSVILVRRVATNPDDGIRLKRMGVCEGRQIRLVQDGDPLILEVVGCRVGISRRLAAQIQVEPFAAAGD